MPFTLATWNINSVRLREPIVLKLLQDEAPDVLCLQECKSPVEKIPTAGFAALGYTHMVARGQKGYNGVAILSKLPLKEVGAADYAGLGHARHVAAAWRSQHPQRRQHTGMDWDERTPHAECIGECTDMQATGTTERHQHVGPRIDTALHRDHAQRLCHVFVGQRNDPQRGVLDTQLQ